MSAPTLERLCAECGGDGGQLVRARLVVRLVEDREHESGYEAWFHRGHLPAGYRVVERGSERLPGAAADARVTERRVPGSFRRPDPGPED